MNSNPYAPPTRKVTRESTKKSRDQVWKRWALVSVFSLAATALALVIFEAVFKAFAQQPWYFIVDGLIAFLILISFVMTCIFGGLWLFSPNPRGR